MITYGKGAYGLNLVFRLHGSAVYKGCIPALVSVAIYIILNWTYVRKGLTQDDVDHPYVIGVLVSSVSFLIIFRANNSYQRYWEGCGAVHHMMSKFLDATVHMASFHMQCSHYDKVKPPVFYDYPEVLDYHLTRDRNAPTTQFDASSNNFDHVAYRSAMSINSFSSKYTKKVRKSKVHVNVNSASTSASASAPQDSHDNAYVYNNTREGLTPLLGEGRYDGGWNKLQDPQTKTEGPALGFPPRKPCKDFGETPSLFLQELAHLSSLLVAVAFSTLRNGDEDGTESPLATYIPGSEWPAPDPDKMKMDEKHEHQTTFMQNIMYWLGMDRTPEYRAKYNAARPLLVLGGVSEYEIKQLQLARGASAKTTLAWYWLSEFIGREHIAGSTGEIGAPIISRLFQFLSDGMIFYNHGRKIMFIPFPFPHAQLSAIFVLVVVLAVPFMMNQFANERWLGAILTFSVVTCLSGLHEVGRELENPYRNIPNDIPLCTLLAMYNEALLAMCSGYHPDGYWNDELDQRRKSFNSNHNPSNNSNGPTAATTTPTSSSSTSTFSSTPSQKEMLEMKKIIDKQAQELKELQAMSAMRKTIDEQGRELRELRALFTKSLVNK